MTPYVSAYTENPSGSTENWAKHFNGGMDLKWGWAVAAFEDPETGDRSEYLTIPITMHSIST